MSKPHLLIVIILMSTFLMKSSIAEVKQSTDNYFELTFDIPMNASANQVNEHILDIASWWHVDHTYSSNSDNLYLDVKKQRCFCEKLDNGGWVSHLQVVFYQPNKMLRLVGGLGPLQASPVNGVLDFVIKTQSEKKAVLTVNYQVSGAGKSLANWAKPVNAVLQTQLERLKKQVENNEK